jgi:hypothetical protein
MAIKSPFTLVTPFQSEFLSIITRHSFSDWSDSAMAVYGLSVNCHFKRREKIIASPVTVARVMVIVAVACFLSLPKYTVISYIYISLRITWLVDFYP